MRKFLAFRGGRLPRLGAMRRGGGDPLAALINTLLSGAAQLIVHPLEYGSMFQDRAGTVPVTATGQLVGQCLDAGGGGYHATAISDAARGVFRDVDGIRYIEYNGVNTAYSTVALAAPLVDKAQLFAGVRKLSDTVAILTELGPNAGSTSGAFYLVAGEDLSSRYSSLASGTASASAALSGIITDFAAVAPDTAVLTATHDIPGDLSRLARNGVYGVDSAGDKGAGNFNHTGTHLLYYGARAGTSLFFNGYHYRTLGPIVRFGTNATPEQIAAAEAYYTARVV